jgi:hypothetical protein
MVKQEEGFWDFNEDKYFVKVKAKDNMDYKIYCPPKDIPKVNEKQELQMVYTNTPTQLKTELANILAQVRIDINKTLICAYLHPELWQDHPISWGITHTFDIHIPCWKKNLSNFIRMGNTLDLINNECIRSGTLFNYQEMPRNKIGILGLNKPKHIISMKLENGKDFELTDRRAIFLTLRDYRTNIIHKYSTILDLALHELTHTTCNDCRWKEDNHKYPYNLFRAKINEIAKKANVLK